MGLFGIKKLGALGAGILAMAMGASLRMNAPRSSQAATPTPIPIGGKRQGTEGDGRPRWRAVWTIPAPEFADAALSPEGANVAWADKSGVVRRTDAATGKTMWQSPAYPGVNAVRITAQGYTLAFARMNPGKAAVRILDAAEGAARSALVPVDGAVWSVEPTADGRLAAVGTGAATLYLMPIRTDAVWPGVATKMNGIPESLAVTTAVAAKEPLLLAGTWLDTGVSVWGLDRNPRWRKRDRESDRAQTVCLSADGGVAVSVSGVGPERRDARLGVWDAHNGKLLWAEELGGDAPKAAVSADGQYIAVSYRQTSPEDNRPANQSAAPKIALFDRTGRRMFNDRGGHFFAPELVCLSADGQRLTVSDDDGNLWTLDRRGRTLSRLRPPTDAKTNLPAKILSVVAAPDGQTLLIRRTDDTLTLYRAAQ